MLKTWLEQQRGNGAALALHLGMAHVSIARWRSGTPIPPDRVAEIERFTGVPAEELRPDLTWRRVKMSGWPKGMPVRINVSAMRAKGKKP